MNKLTPMMFLCLLVQSAYSQIEYPEAIQARFDSNRYIEIFRGELGEDVPGFSDAIGTYVIALDLDNFDSNALVVRYPISAGSFGTNTGSGAFSGFAFVEGRVSYDLDEEDASFNLYLEQVEPSIVSPSSNTFLFDTIDLTFVTESAALTGVGSYCMFFDTGDCFTLPCETSPQNLNSLNTPEPCIGSCCGVSAEFRLPGLNYVENNKYESERVIEFEPTNEFDFKQPNFNLLYYQDIFSIENGRLQINGRQRFEIPLFQTGDVNRDGAVDLLDVSGFIECLVSGVYNFQCDTDSNQIVNLLDVAGFVDLVIGK